MTASPDNAASQQRSSLILWLILGICVLPIIGSTLLFYFDPPQERMNYGDIIAPPRPLPKLVLPDVDGRLVPLEGLLGTWTMVQIDGGGCAQGCQAKLYKMRQVRLTQNKNMERIKRLWLVNDAASISPVVRRDYEGTVTLRADKAALNQLLQALPASAAPEAHIWLIDPLGNVMLRFPPDADPTRIKNDLSRLLSISHIG